jgi:hypothetical protein
MSEYKVTGKITAILPTEPIADGKYRKKVFVVTNQDGYEGADKIYAFEIFEKADGERIANFEKYNKEGQTVEVSFDIRVNENRGRYFTSLSAWKVWTQKSDESAPVDTPMEDGADEEPPF